MDIKNKKLFFDIQEAAQDILTFTSGMKREEYRKNDLVQAAVERKFEIIGEALSRISRDNPELLVDIPDHPRIISFRNLIAHGYDIVDHEIVWEVVETKLPDLLNVVKLKLAD